MSRGFGGSSWGSSTWGGASALSLQLVDAVAISENLVQLRFTKPVYFSSILDVGDASDPAHYVVTVVAGGVGLDGSPARVVAVVSATLATDTLPTGATPGTVVDVTTDRPLTPYPSVYGIVVAGLMTPAGSPLDVAASKAQFLGSFKEIVQPDASSPHPARDFANPQTLAALVDAASGAPGGTLGTPQLGAFLVDVTGDYALDSGMTALKKRIYRRLMTTPGAFVHLGEGYGVGVVREGKRLASAAVIGRIAARAEAQISLEPEVAQVRVRAINDNAGLVRFVMLVRTRAGADAKFTAVFPIR